MTDRSDQIDAFLAVSGWPMATRTPLAGDASARRYARVTLRDTTAILMDAPPETCGPQDAFLQVGAFLASIGLSAPECFAQDPRLGLYLFEDLGDLLFATLIKHDPGLELPLYSAATDALVQIQSTPCPAWAHPYGPAEMADAIRPAWTFYLKQDGPPSRAWQGLEDHLSALLKAQDLGPEVLIHRDFHAENLIWLPDRTGTARVGVLDYQDALAGHPAYDLASLLQDARRDTSHDVADKMIARFARARGLSQARLRAAIAVQGTQRHLRILGIFARLAATRGKPGYLALMPRVWRDLHANLAHPVLAPLRPLIRDLLPEPLR